jgi:outer membrane protein assembly factor BamB
MLVLMTRSGKTFLVSAFFALLMLTTFGPATGSQPDTAMFRADAAHSGIYASDAPTLNTVKWRFQTRGAIISSPTVLNGVVYFGSGDGNVYAVEASDGSLLWAFSTKGPVNSSPAIGDGSVFIASLDGNVYALDPSNGREKWRFKTEGERRFTAPGIHGLIPRTELMPDPFDVFLSSPTLWKGIVYIGSGDHNVYALDASSGALRWKFTTRNVVHASAAVAGGTVYIGSWDRFMYALDAASGAVRWKFSTGDDRNIYNQVGIAGSAAVANGLVYFGCRDSFFYALDAATGQLRWKHDEHGSWVIATPATTAESVFFTTSDQRKLFALAADTGSERYSVDYGTFAYSSPSLAGHVAYFGTFDGRLYGVDIRTGKVLATFSTDASRRDLPAHLNAKGKLDLSTIYDARTLDGTIVGLNRLFDLGAIAGSAAISDGILYIGAGDGILYAIT